jgi:hypothetical protein
MHAVEWHWIDAHDVIRLSFRRCGRRVCSFSSAHTVGPLIFRRNVREVRRSSPTPLRTVKRNNDKGARYLSLISIPCSVVISHEVLQVPEELVNVLLHTGEPCKASAECSSSLLEKKAITSHLQVCRHNFNLCEAFEGRQPGSCIIRCLREARAEPACPLASYRARDRSRARQCTRSPEFAPRNDSSNSH